MALVPPRTIAINSLHWQRFMAKWPGNPGKVHFDVSHAFSNNDGGITFILFADMNPICFLFILTVTLLSCNQLSVNAVLCKNLPTKNHPSLACVLRQVEFVTKI